MSTVKANNYYDTTGGSNAQLYGVASPPNSMGFRNRIINGDMRIDQRNAGASVNVGGALAYPVDRFAGFNSTSGTFTLQRSTTAPTGFTNSVLLTVTGASGALGATQRATFQQRIEGFNIADLGWGTASAQTVTLSFVVRSSLTGTFGGALTNDASTRSYPFTYTINAANTWETKTVTIPGETSGVWNTDNTAGIYVVFGLGVGSTYSGTAGSWANAGLNSATGATNIIATNGATFYITGVQLEAGTVASPFERRDYGRELIMCQRYCYVIGGTAAYESVGYGVAIGSTVVNVIAWAPVEMRAQPASTQVGTWQVSNGSSAFSSSSLGIQTGLAGKQSIALGITSSGLSAGALYRIEAANSTASKLILSSEL